MKYLAFIPYVNREDLLRKAIETLEFKVGKNLVLIDNSDNHDLQKEYYAKYKVITPTVPLYFTQTMNLMQKIAFEKKLKFFIFMHNDAQGTKARVNALFTEVEKAFKEKKKWGIMFTFYDCLCAYNVKAVKDIGPWDVNFTQYFADNDYFRRMRLKGYETLESGNQGMSHIASTTMKNNFNRFLGGNALYGGYRHLYFMKWGGYEGQETYTKPYDKLDL